MRNTPENKDSFKKLCGSQCSHKRDLIVISSPVRLIITEYCCQLVAWVCMFVYERENILSGHIGPVTTEHIVCLIIDKLQQGGCALERSKHS